MSTKMKQREDEERQLACRREGRLQMAEEQQAQQQVMVLKQRVQDRETLEQRVQPAQQEIGLTCGENMACVVFKVLHIPAEPLNFRKVTCILKKLRYY